MGEPLNNFEHVKAAVLGLTDSNLFGMGRSHGEQKRNIILSAFLLFCQFLWMKVNTRWFAKTGSGQTQGQLT